MAAIQKNPLCCMGKYQTRIFSLSGNQFPAEDGYFISDKLEDFESLFTMNVIIEREV